MKRQWELGPDCPREFKNEKYIEQKIKAMDRISEGDIFWCIARNPVTQKITWGGMVFGTKDEVKEMIIELENFLEMIRKIK